MTTLLRLWGWSVLMGCAALAAVWIMPVLLVALVLVPLWVGVPFTVLVLGWVRDAADLHRLWAIRYMGTPIPRPYRSHAGANQVERLQAVTSDPATWRDVRWLVSNAVVGAAMAAVPMMSFLVALIGVQQGVRLHTDPYDYQIHPWAPWALLIVGTSVFGLSLLLARPTLRAYTAFLRWMLGPAEKTRLANRVDELTRTRTETLDTQAAEIRRIERDLHDGAQARLVSLGMNLGMAEKLMVADPGAALQLVAQAKQSTGHALSELRELVHGIHPPILADRGLDGAAQALALASPLPITVSVSLPARPPAPVESAVYFALTEIVANVTKHSAATTAWIRVDHQGGRLVVMVADNGMGGAVCRPGGGLDGIGRRLAAFDGTVSVASPTGGPTIITMEVPCPLGSASS